jgi:hypothetical protein
MEDNSRPSASTSPPEDGIASTEQMDETELDGKGASRRQFMSEAAYISVALVAAQLLPADAAVAYAHMTRNAKAQSETVGTMPVRLRVNGTKRILQLEPRVTLLDAMRDGRSSHQEASH